MPEETGMPAETVVVAKFVDMAVLFVDVAEMAVLVACIVQTAAIAGAVVEFAGMAPLDFVAEVVMPTVASRARSAHNPLLIRVLQEQKFVY